jgi:hypothetical protein
MSSKSRLESMKIIVALVVGLLVSLGTYAQVSQVSTASAQWSLESSRSYEESSPGLGISRTFRSSYGWIDVFSYGLGRSNWREGTADPQFAEQFSQNLAGVRQAGAQGLLSDFAMGSTREVKVGGQPFRTASFSFRLRGEPSDSAVYLTAKGGQLLKYRITVKANSSPAMTQLAEEFIARDLASRSGISEITASAADPIAIASIKNVIKRCQAVQAAKAPNIGPVKDGGGFVKTQELGARYGLELPTAASPSEPMFANVEIATSLVGVRAATEEAVRQMPLSVMGPDVTTMVRRY